MSDCKWLSVLWSEVFIRECGVSAGRVTAVVGWAAVCRFGRVLVCVSGVRYHLLLFVVCPCVAVHEFRTVYHAEVGIVCWLLFQRGWFIQLDLVRFMLLHY